MYADRGSSLIDFFWFCIGGIKVVLCVVLLVFFTCGAVCDAQTQQTLIAKEDIKYLGAFRLPNTTINGTRFGYGGRGITAYKNSSNGNNTLFMEGHAHYPGLVAQVEIPNSFVTSKNYTDLPLATVLQNFYDVVDEKWNTLGQPEYGAIFGMIPYNNRLIIGASSWYDASCRQNTSHGFSTFELSNSGDFSGFSKLNAVADPRSLGGYMGYVPQEWRALFGGPVLTGNNGLSIISCVSVGPAISVFDPDKLGTSESVDATTLIYYPLSNLPSDLDKNKFLNADGVAFPTGSRSILFIGTFALGDYCYGSGVQDISLHMTYCHEGSPTVLCCYDPCSSDKGGHYTGGRRHYIWAYDANELLKVKNKEKQPWDMRPYATWALTEMDDGNCQGTRGAFYDSSDGRLYITQAFGEVPKVDVYHIESTHKIPHPPARLEIR